MNKYCKVNNCRYPTTHVTSYHLCGTCKNVGHGMVECCNSNKINNLKQYYNETLPTIENINEYCSFGGCSNSSTHKTESHICELCHERFHSSSTCPTIKETDKESNIECPICRKINRSSIRSFGSANKCVVCFEDSQIFLPECGHECLCVKCCKKINKNNKNKEIYYDEQDLNSRKYDITLIKSYLKEYPSYVAVYIGMGCNTLVRRLNESCELEALFVHSDDGYDPNKIRLNQEFINGYCKIDKPIYHDL